MEDFTLVTKMFIFHFQCAVKIIPSSPRMRNCMDREARNMQNDLCGMMPMMWEAPCEIISTDTSTLEHSFVAMGHSDKCRDPKTYFDRSLSRCVLCTFKPGYEVTPNCGYDDVGGRHEAPLTLCKTKTFNDGSRAYCQPCAICPPGFNTTSNCSTTSDTICKDLRSGTIEGSIGETTASPHASTFFSTAPTIQTSQRSILKPNATTVSSVLYTKKPTQPDSHDAGLQWAVPLVILISIMLVVIFACLIYMKRKRGPHSVLTYSRRSSYIKAGFSPLSPPSGNKDVENMLSPNILSAPLQTVLDNLDVLEELVILLDPESHGVKNTKHLASHCSFPSTWITYTYSMRESKSPLKAVLEGLTSRNPDWTVRHLAKLLSLMERNDAIAVLAKLGQDV